MTDHDDRLPLAGLRRISIELDTTIARTRKYLRDHGCKTIVFAGAECIPVAEVSRLMRLAIDSASRPDSERQ